MFQRPSEVHCRPFQSLLHMNVRHRNSVPCSLSPDGPNGREHMKKDLPACGSESASHKDPRLRNGKEITREKCWEQTIRRKTVDGDVELYGT